MIIVTIITVIIVDVYDCSFVTGFALIITTYLFITQCFAIIV